MTNSNNSNRICQRFTKEYRKNVSDNTQTNTVNELIDGQLPSTIDKVVFFGHSLSEVDHYELKELLKNRVTDNTQFVIYIFDRNKTKDRQYVNNLKDILNDTKAENMKYLTLKDSDWKHSFIFHSLFFNIIDRVAI